MFPSASGAVGGLRTAVVGSASARSFAIPSALSNLMPAVVVDKESPVLPSRPVSLNVSSLNNLLPNQGLGLAQKSSFSFARPTQVRLAHTDATRVPDFNSYRRQSTRDPTKSARSSEASRKTFSYVVGVGATGVATVYASKSFLRDLGAYFGPAADVLALAKVEVKLGDIPEGKSTVVKWRGKPLFIRHRTAAEIDQEKNVDLATLRDPETDAQRAQNPEWLVLIGVCTHLGCVPIPYVGEYRGYFCPCHGSVYDASGRIRAGPAPTNLEVPKYEFIDDGGTVVVG